jgi:hypothetical protein
LQLEQIAATGTEMSLLADVTEKNPKASYIELLRLFKVRRSVADGHSQRARCLRASVRRCRTRPSVRFYAVCLFACLFVCLFVCLRPALAKHTVDGAAYAARASSRGCPFSRFAAQECVAAVRALVRRRQPRRAAATQALHQCVCVAYPRRGEYCAVIESSPRTHRHPDRPDHCM